MSESRAQKLTPGMLEIMAQPDMKSSGLLIKLVLKDGSKRDGIYKNLVVNPLNRHEFKDIQFVVFEVKKEHDTVYLPITLIDTIEWSY